MPESMGEKYREVMALAGHVNGASDGVRTLWLGFLAFMTFLALAVFGTTHEDLFLETPLALPPPVSVEINLWGFYFIAPLILVVIHGYLLLKLLFLKYVYDDFEAQVRKDIGLRIDRVQARKHLNITLFTRVLMSLGGFISDAPLNGAEWRRRYTVRVATLFLAVTVIVLPLSALLFIWIRFLPYQYEAATLWHRVLFAIDMIAIVWAVWMIAGFRLLARMCLVLFVLLILAALSIRHDVIGRLVQFAQKGGEMPDWQQWLIVVILFAIVLAGIVFRKLLGNVIRYIFKIVERVWTDFVALLSDGFRHFAEQSFSYFVKTMGLFFIFCGPALVVLPAWFLFTFPRECLQDDRKWDDGRYQWTGGEAWCWDRNAVSTGLVDTLKLRRITDRKRSTDGKEAPKMDFGTDALLWPPVTLNVASQQIVYHRFVREQGGDLTALKRTLNLEGRSFVGADLQDVDLRKAYLVGADLRGIIGKNLNLKGAALQGSHLQAANMREAELQGADLLFANLQEAELWEAQLQGANLRSARLQGAKLGSARLQGANLRGANLQGADLLFANLQGADLEGAQLQGADLLFANLQGANLEWAELQGADLVGAHLQGADLLFANLQGANLVGAYLQGALMYKTALWRAEPPGDLKGVTGVALDFTPLNNAASQISAWLKNVPDGDEKAANGNTKKAAKERLEVLTRSAKQQDKENKKRWEAQTAINISDSEERNKAIDDHLKAQYDIYKALLCPPGDQIGDERKNFLVETDAIATAVTERWSLILQLRKASLNVQASAVEKFLYELAFKTLQTYSKLLQHIRACRAEKPATANTAVTNE